MNYDRDVYIKNMWQLII